MSLASSSAAYLFLPPKAHLGGAASSSTTVSDASGGLWPPRDKETFLLRQKNTSRGINRNVTPTSGKASIGIHLTSCAACTFDDPGIYYYWCSPHKSMGMIALVVVGGDKSNIEDIAGAKAVGKSKKKLAVLLNEV